MLEALIPMKSSERLVKSDKYIQIKEQWLLERYFMLKQIEKENRKQRTIQKIINVQQLITPKRSQRSVPPPHLTVATADIRTP